MKAVFLTGVLLLLAVVDGEPAAGQETEPVVGSPGLELSSMMASGHWELRIYTINRGQLDEFVAAWLAGPYRIRTEHGFGIPAAWISRENNQFIWIVGYDGPESWDEKKGSILFVRGTHERRGGSADDDCARRHVADHPRAVICRMGKRSRD